MQVAAAAASTARKPCDGTAITTTSAPAHASPRSCVAPRSGRERDAGEVRRGSRAPRRSAPRARARGPTARRRRSRRRARRPRCPTTRHRRPRPARARRRASSAPPRRHRSGQTVSGRRTHHPSSSGRGPLRIDLTRPGDARCDRAMIRSRGRVDVVVGRRRAPVARRRRISATPHRHVGFRPLNMMRCAPQSPTGVTGTPARSARRAVPVLPAIGSRSSEMVPSGNTATHSPRAQRVDRGVERTGRRRRSRADGDLASVRSRTAERRACRTARPWRGSAPGGAVGRRRRRARTDRGTRCGCSRGSPARARGFDARPRSSTASQCSTGMTARPSAKA